MKGCCIILKHFKIGKYVLKKTINVKFTWLITYKPIITLYVDELSFLKNEMKKNPIFEKKNSCGK